MVPIPWLHVLDLPMRRRFMDRYLCIHIEYTNLIALSRASSLTWPLSVRYLIYLTTNAIIFPPFPAHTPKFECYRDEANGTEILVDACYNDTTADCDSLYFRHPYTSVVTEASICVTGAGYVFAV